MIIPVFILFSGNDVYSAVFNAEGNRIVDVLPQKHQLVSPLQAVGMDLVLPGSGMLMFEKYYWSAGYAIAKAGSIYYAYYTIRDYQFARSLEHSARARQNREPGILKFQNPKDPSGYMSLHQIHSQTGTAALEIVFAGLLNITVFTASAVHTWMTAEAWNENAGPKFKIRKLDDGSGSIDLSYNIRF